MMICIATADGKSNSVPSRLAGLRLEPRTITQSSVVVSTLARRTFPGRGGNAVGSARQQI